jgi:5'(3')-deoxyribonucleotidase
MFCFLDMDGVIADFVGGASRAHGREDPFDYPPGEMQPWDMAGTWGITDDEFWAPFTVEMWAELEPTPFAQEVLERVERTFDSQHICLLTDPGRYPAVAIPGKLAWMEQHVPAYRRERRYFFGHNKHFCAGYSGNLLIDDHNGNVEEFRKLSSQAFLFPRPWNYGFAESLIAVEQLDTYLDQVWS